MVWRLLQSNHSLKSSTIEVVAATTLSWLWDFCHDCFLLDFNTVFLILYSCLIGLQVFVVTHTCTHIIIIAVMYCLHYFFINNCSCFLNPNHACGKGYALRVHSLKLFSLSQTIGKGTFLIITLGSVLYNWCSEIEIWSHLTYGLVKMIFICLLFNLA